MPDAFKGHHTYDEDDNQIEIMTPEEVEEALDNFFHKDTKGTKR